MKTAYYNGIMLDGSENMNAQKDKIILTDKDKIEKILEDGVGNIPQGYEAVDLKGQYIMPGLINMHVHLPASGKPKKKEQDNAKMVKIVTSNALFRSLGVKLCESYAKMELLSGVTTIRTVGGVLDFDTKIRDKVAAGQLKAPRILAANMAVSVPGGHMAGSLAYTAESAEDAMQYVEMIAKDKPDLIKLMITGGVLDAKVKGEPGVLKMPAEYVKVACDRAHSLGLIVSAHVESPEGVKVALENGVDTIEHGAAPDEEMLELFKQKNASFIATISPALSYALFDRSVSHATEMSQYNGKIVFEGGIECAKKCLEKGIRVGLGTDTGCPYVTHYDMWRELNYYHKYCGVSNQFALYTGTLGNAKIAGIDHITGSIEEGKCADFIVTEQNPLEQLSTLRNISMVVARGKRIEHPHVKKMQEVEVELDKFI